MTHPSQSQSSCPRCGAQVSPAALFCRSCGQPFTIAAPRFCPACGQPAALDARFCKECGQVLSNTAPTIAKTPPPPITVKPPVPSPPAPPVPRAGSKGRSPKLWLAGCAALIVVGVVAVGGYFGYRHWSSLPVAQESTGDSGQEVDADWGGSDLASPDLRQAHTQIDPHVARLTEAASSGNLQTVLSMTMTEAREDLRMAFEAHPERMERFGRLLASRRLKAVEGNLAEFEVTEEGRVFVVTFQRVGDNWALHSY